jgi:predicted transcriptional regulator
MEESRLEQALKALANEKRIMILKLLLEEKEMFLQGISERLNIPLKTASRNLALLKTAGFVLSKTKRAQVMYQINVEAKEDHIVTLLMLLRSVCFSRIKKRAANKVDFVLGSSFASVAKNLITYLS